MNAQFDYEGAKKAGYSDQEIEGFLASQPKQPKYETYGQDDSAFTKIAKNFRNFFGNLGNPIQREENSQEDEVQVNHRLLKKVPNFDVEGAIGAGYSPNEINEFLEENQPKRSTLEQTGRIGAQYGIGLSENALLPYELATAPLSSKEAMNVPYREYLGDELESLMEKKAAGQWSPEDQQLYENITQEILDPRKSLEHAQTLEVGVRDLAEKATGIDLHPEGVLEKAANWIGFIKSPKNAKDLVKLGTNPKSIRNAIMPGGKDILRGLTAGTALQMAENNQFGPIGTMGAAIIGDLSGGGIAAITKALTHPKQTLSNGFSLISNTKGAIKSDLKEAIQGTEFTKDLGTLTNNNMVQMIQSKLSASGLTGKPLQDLRKQMTQEIVKEYESIAKELGEARFQSLHEAGEVAKEGIKKIRDADKAIYQEVYEFADKSLKKGALGDAEKLSKSIKFLRENLSPGQLKSTEQQAVLTILDKLEKDIHSVNGKLKSDVKSLTNSKIALNDIINYEVQGGAKQLLKNLVSEVDRAIISHGKENPTFVRNYVSANKKFAEHAKTFRNKNIDQIIRMQNPEQLMHKMDSIQGIRDLNKALSKNPEGKKIFNGLARKKLDMMIGDNMKDGITDQIKLGKLHNIIQDPKNRSVLKEILSKDAYKKLVSLQNHVGELAETAQKFLNASQSATAGADMVITGNLLGATASALMGNPWGMGQLGIFLGARSISHLIADPEFLKLTEDAIKASRKNNLSVMQQISKKMAIYAQEISGPLSQLPTTTQEPA